MSTQFVPLEGCEQTAEEMQDVLAESVLHLFKDSLNPDPSTPLADYTTAEATYSGYAAQEFTNWNDPILAPGSGYMIGSPLVQFSVETASPVVGNQIAGAYLIDSNGKLRLTVIFTQVVPMEIVNQGIPINLVWLFPTGV